MRGDEDKCLAAGCSGYLSKPVQIDRLLNTVRSALALGATGPCDAQPAALLAAAERIESTLPVQNPAFRRIVDEFIGKLPDKVEEMHAASAAGDWDRLAKLAHWLKGSGGTVGFDCLTEPARQLETSAARHDTLAVHQALQSVQELTDRIASVPA
jgi:HPt (histidine-containing phosphotransfer) domain-containing protein